MSLGLRMASIPSPVIDRADSVGIHPYARLHEPGATVNVVLYDRLSKLLRNGHNETFINT